LIYLIISYEKSPKTNNIDKEKIKEEIEKLKKEHFIKRGEKLFFKKDKENTFILMTNKEFCKLFIPFKLFRSKEELIKEKIFEIAEDKLNQYLDVFNFFDLHEDLLRLKLIILNNNQNSLFDFIRKRTFEEISEEKYFENLLESIVFYKENSNNLNYKDERIMDNIEITLKKLIQ